MRGCFASFVIAASLSCCAAQDRQEQWSAPAAREPGDGALDLLDRVVRHYLEAESVHLQATQTNSSRNAFYESHSEETLSATEASGGRFRYEGTDYTGSGLIVSDGTTEWRLLRSFGEYAAEPTGTYFNRPILLQGDDKPMNDAHHLLDGITALTIGIRSAHFGPEDTLKVGGRSVRCVTVQFGTEDRERKERYGSVFTTTVWIDRATLQVLKQQMESQSHFFYGMQVPPHAPAIENVRATVYTETEVGAVPAAGTFTFTAPGDAKEVATLPSPNPNAAAEAAKGPTLAEKIETEQMGKPLGDVEVHDAEGKAVSLRQYLGHPLLIDVWATWCGPCVMELPELEHIRASTEKTDLQMIAVDQDDKPGVAADMLARRGYKWQDFHGNLGVKRILPTTGIPLTVLVDASGTIVYYHVGADDAKGLAQAVAKLGKPYEGVSAAP